jgi:hypothetical protein
VHHRVSEGISIKTLPQLLPLTQAAKEYIFWVT